MKTPREILLARHQAANAKLDAIRQAVVAEATSKPAREPEISFILKLWCELIYPCRWTWAGLAATWLVLATFNLSHSTRNHVITAETATPPGEIRLALQEQRRVLNEIIGQSAARSPVEPPRRRNDQPRSQLLSIAIG